MKKYILIALLLSITFFAGAQSKTEPYISADDIYGTRATKTTTVSTDEKLNRKITIEIKDNDGIVRERHVWESDILNNWTITEEILKPSGTVVYRYSSTFDANGKYIRYTCKRGSSEKVFERTADGSMKEKSGKCDPMSAESVKRSEKDFSDEKKEIEDKVIPSLQPPKVACNCAEGQCNPSFAAFAGPSILISDYGTESEIFFGGHVAALIRVTDHIDAGADASFHTKKAGTEHLNRSFLFGEVRYAFRDPGNCNQKLTGDVHLLAGIGWEKFGNFDNHGFAFGAGGAIEYNISRNIGIKLQGDFIGVKFKNTDETNKNLRASFALLFKAQQNY